MTAARLVGSFILLELVLCCHCFFWGFLGCPPCEQVQCPKLSCNQSLQVYDPSDECGCCPTCRKAYKADGETCGGLSNEHCLPDSICRYRLGVIIGENRTGICEPGECKSVTCDYRHFCGYLQRRSGPLLICHCPYYNCTAKYNPVCGYDGNNYNSICHLQSEECYQNRFIGLRQFGRCPVEPPTEDPHYLVTNTVPSNEDDLFDQIVEPVADRERPTVQQGCMYEKTEYAANSMVQLDPDDPCTYLHCDGDLNLAMIKVPGCGDGPVDPDYGVSQPAVHGGWTAWEEGECLGTCFAATKTNRRYCTKPAPRYEGRNCSGPSEEVFKCIPKDCNYTCEYSEWSEWSPCSQTCSTGTQSRSRTLLVNLTAEEANNCDLSETRSCYIVAYCPTTCQKVIAGYERMVDINGCKTVSMWPVYKCAGPCSNDRCCRATRLKQQGYAVQCPGEIWHRESRFDVIARCSCKRNCPENS